MALTSAGKLGAQKKLSVLIGRTFYIIRSHNLSNIGWFESSKGKLYKHNSPSFLNLIVFRIVRILLLKVSEEKVLLDSAARVLSEDVWLSAVFFITRCPSVVLVRVVRHIFAKKYFTRHRYLYGGIKFFFSVPE